MVFLFPYTPMQEVTPKVVAIAVSTVMTMFRILLQIDLFSMMFFCFRINTYFLIVIQPTFCHSERSEESEKR